MPRRDPSGRWGAPEAGEISFLELILVLLEQWKALVGVPLTLLFVVVLWALLRPRTFTVSTAFLPQSGVSVLAPAVGLAARFGVSIPQADPSQSPQFYGGLVKSREVLRLLATSRYEVPPAPDPLSLVELLEVPGETEDERIEEAIRQLQDLIGVTLQVETGVVQIDVTTERRDLSLQMAQRLLDLLNDFNLRRRQAKAAADRRFTEERVEEAAGELREAEDELQGFLTRNRQYETSPQLAFDFDRLRRAVGMRQEVYTSLVQSLNSARLEEMRNTPLITVVEAPRAPATPDRRYLLFKAVLSMILGAVVATALILGHHSFRRAMGLHPDAAERLKVLRSEVYGLTGSRLGRQGSAASEKSTLE